MIEELITFKTAKLAKEKRLEAPKMGELSYSHEGTGPEQYRGWGPIYAPTQSLLQKWLREVHNITISVNSYTINKTKQVQWSIDVKYINPQSLIFEHDGYDIYEECLEIGLQEALKLIKI
jgi:hypothetical protein